MKKLLAILGLSLVLSGFGKNSYSQSPKDSIPEAVKKKAAQYLSYAGSNCGSVPNVSLVGEKLEDREKMYEVKDGIKDKVSLYQIDNPCDWSNVPTHFTYVFYGKKDGTFEKKGCFEEEGIISREGNKPVMPKNW
jgi:hypothetical protein